MSFSWTWPKGRGSQSWLSSVGPKKVYFSFLKIALKKKMLLKKVKTLAVVSKSQKLHFFLIFVLLYNFSPLSNAYWICNTKNCSTSAKSCEIWKIVQRICNFQQRNKKYGPCMPLLMNITKGHYLTIRASSACRSSGDTFLLIGPKGSLLTPRPAGDTFFTIGPKGPFFETPSVRQHVFY